MQATRSVHLIFQRPITEFSQTAKEDLAGQRVQCFPLIESKQNTAAKCRVTKIL